MHSNVCIAQNKIDKQTDDRQSANHCAALSLRINGEMAAHRLRNTSFLQCFFGCLDQTSWKVSFFPPPPRHCASMEQRHVNHMPCLCASESCGPRDSTTKVSCSICSQKRFSNPFRELRKKSVCIRSPYLENLCVCATSPDYRIEKKAVFLFTCC